MRRPACAGPASKRHASRRLAQDLHRSALVVREGVGGIRVLVWIEVGLWIPGDQLANEVDGAVGAFSRIAVNNLGAVSRDERLALRAHVARHDQLDRIAFGRPDHRVCDAGIAGGRVDERLVGSKSTAPLAVFDHGQRGAVLDRPAGIEPLGLRVDLHSRELGFEHADAQERRVSDQSRDLGADDALLLGHL